MKARVLGPVLLLALAVLAWVLWPNRAELGPRTGADATPTATAPDPSTAHANAPTPPPPTPPDPATRSEVTTAATFLVQGRAVSAPDTPVADARVRARAFAGTEAKGTPTLDTVLTADAQGRFVWTLTPPPALTCLELKGEGEQVRSYPETFVLAPGDAPPSPFDLWIVPLSAVARGRVVDERGQPIAGARVGSSWRDGEPTDQDGRFTTAVERKASVTLYARAHGFVQLRQEVAIDVQKGEGEATLTLRPAVTLRGRVVDDDGRPVAGATARTFYTLYTEAAESDADGRFVLDNLDPSLKSHSAFVRKAGYVEAKREVEATDLKDEHTFVLGRGVEVRGRVLGPQGQLLAAATVFLGFSPSAYNRLDAVSDGDGRFAFACVPAGEETLNVERRGFAGHRRKITVPKPPAPPLVVDVQLDAGHFVGGIAHGQDGKPIEGVSIAPRLDGEYLDGIRAKTDAKGRFRLDGLPARGLALEFYGNGVLRHEHKVDAVDRDDLDVGLERHGRMAGTVVDGATQKPIADFRIRFGTARLQAGESSGGGYSASWVRGGKQFHDPNGVFRIDEEVQVGSVFALEASAQGYGASIDDHVVVTLDPDPAQTVIALWPAVAIEGVVRERGTALPIAGARLIAFAAGRPLQPHEPNDLEGRPVATSDGRGAFRLEGVGQGDISIVVSHPDWVGTTFGPVRIAGAVAPPPQVVELDHGAEVTVDLRAADGAPLADAELLLLAREHGERRARTDAQGRARFPGLQPGAYEAILVQTVGGRQVWTFRRRVQVEGNAVHLDFVASDGDATLAVIVDAGEPLPAELQVMVTAKTPAPDGKDPFQLRGAAIVDGRAVLERLPARALHVLLIGPMGWSGSTEVTTVGGQTVEVHVIARKIERQRR